MSTVFATRPHRPQQGNFHSYPFNSTSIRMPTLMSCEHDRYRTSTHVLTSAGTMFNSMHAPHSARGRLAHAISVPHHTPILLTHGLHRYGNCTYGPVSERLQALCAVTTPTNRGYCHRRWTLFDVADGLAGIVSSAIFTKLANPITSDGPAYENGQPFRLPISLTTASRCDETPCAQEILSVP